MSPEDRESLQVAFVKLNIPRRISEDADFKEIEGSLISKGVSEGMAIHACNIIRDGVRNNIAWMHLEDYDIERLIESICSRTCLKEDVIKTVVEAVKGATSASGAAIKPGVGPSRSASSTDMGTCSNENVPGTEITDEHIPDAWDYPYLIFDKSGTVQIRGKFDGSRITIPPRVLIDGNIVNVTAIGSGSFHGCKSLLAVDMPSVESVGESAFSDCTSLELVDMPSVTSVGKGAFYGCSSLSAVHMPSVTSVGDHAFGKCTSLKSVDMPNVTSIGDLVFDECRSLESINVSPRNTAYISMDGVLYSREGWVLVRYPPAKAGREYVAPSSVRSISNKAFHECTSLSTVKMPSVESVGEFAFRGCTSLELVDMPSVTSVWKYAFDECSSLESVNMPNVISIGIFAFYHCFSLKSVNLPNVAFIGDDAFICCSSLESVDIPSVESIGKNAFSSCTSLKSIDVNPENTAYMSIDGALFSKDGWVLVRYPPAKAGHEYVVPSSVRSIEKGAFNCCTSLSTVEMTSVTIINDSAFWGCTSLSTVKMPSVRSIGRNAFCDCTSISHMDMPSVESISEGSFYKCKSLASVNMPHAHIHNSAFNGTPLEKTYRRF